VFILFGRQRGFIPIITSQHYFVKIPWLNAAKIFIFNGRRVLMKFKAVIMGQKM
jgi:hypothetical protein